MSIITIENLSKKYIIAHEGQAYASLKEIIVEKSKRIVQKIRHPLTPLSPSTSIHEEFWAVQNLNLAIESGDRVALLGRNGAGKSTLLKLLSRIIEPTTGRITLKGRVASLLEVGTGFHPELTGRENILLSGAIMGMSYKEIRKKFDEIIAFADIEKFLDTPIKRYSSGMFMRLGFAIIANLDSEILILDEVLAVGDTQFQEKCLKKMSGMSGKTVLFVSHSLSSVLSLCNKGIFLNKGQLEYNGPIEQCIQHYMHSCPTTGLTWKGNISDEHIVFHQASIATLNSSESFFHNQDKTTLELDLEILKAHTDLIIGFSILNSRHQIVAHSRLCDHLDHIHTSLKRGCHHIKFDLDFSLFHPGEYQLRIECGILNQKKIVKDEIILNFTICSSQPLLKYAMGDEKEGISLGNRWMTAASSL